MIKRAQETCRKCEGQIDKSDPSVDYAVHTTKKTDGSEERFYLCETCNNEMLMTMDLI